MNVTTILLRHSRRFLQQPNTAAALRSSLPPATTPAASVEAAAVEAASRGTPPFSLDSSLTLTVLLLLTAIFFMGFFSFFISRSTAAAHHHRSATSAASDRRGIHPSVLGSLPLTSFSAETAKADGCSICLSEFSEGESVKLIPNCGHVFHPRCVDTWLSAHVTCPLCRRSPQSLKSENEA